MKHTMFVLFAVLFLFGCGKKRNAEIISSVVGEAESVYLTKDAHDLPAVVWTEKREDERMLSFATISENGKSFIKIADIPLTADVAVHAEGMPKVAFKKDGSIIAAYERRSPTVDNKYASVVCYVMSRDGGQSWTREAFVHSDTSAGKSRSYFDIERLPDGEIGAAWLDVKGNNDLGGRSVRFARTSPSKGFSGEVIIDPSACQCCRIDVYTDESENIFVAYRGLKKGNLGKQIRDMLIATSTDYGTTFSAPITISADNWNIDGCPHTGPSLCSNKAGLISLWYTEGSGSGIYYAQKNESDPLFASRQRVSEKGRHPQLSALDDRIAMVWEENIEHDGALKTVIRYRIARNGTVIESGALTPPDKNAFLPVVTQTQDGFLVAYLMEKRGDQVGVYWTRL